MGRGVRGTKIRYKISYKDILYNTKKYSQYFIITIKGV